VRARLAVKRLFVVIASALLIASAAARAEDGQTTSLTLRTDTGIIVVEGSQDDINRWRGMLFELSEPPSTNRAVLRWLADKGIPSGAVRSYANSADPSSNLGSAQQSWRKMTVAEAVMSGEIPCVIGKELYEAYILIKASGDKMYILKNTTHPAAASPAGFQHSIFIISSAFYSGNDGIFVDGENLSKSVLGYNIVTFSPDGKTVTGSDGFELFNKPDDSRRMADFLNSQPAGAYAAAAVKFGPGVFLFSDATAALRAYGSQAVLDPQVLSSHAILGVKGSPAGDALEATAVNLSSEIIVFKDDLYVEETRLEELSEGVSGRIIVLGGSKPSDTVYVLE